MISNQTVVSSNIKSIGYNDVTCGLLIIFKSGKSYIYSGVEKSVFEKLMAASSKGKHLNAFIKPNYSVQGYETEAEGLLILTAANNAPVAASPQKGKPNLLNLRDCLRIGVPTLNLFSF